MSESKGFTLVELLIVIAIISILSTIGMAVYGNVQSRARDTRRVSDIDAISKAYETHFNQNSNSQYPPPDSTSWFGSGSYPQDPINSSDYYYSWSGNAKDAIPSSSSQTFTICAKLENNNGNSSDFGNGTTFTVVNGNGDHYCRKNLQ